MKKSFVFLSLLVLCTSFFSFTTNRGGDVLQIFLNGRQVHQQFVHADKSVKTLHFASLSENDRIEVFYSHCGYAGKSRVLFFKNEKDEVMKEMKYPDAAGNQRFMPFYRKNLPKDNSGTVKLYYSAKELPSAMWIATLTWGKNKGRTNTALL
jgi:hypothetical protein